VADLDDTVEKHGLLLGRILDSIGEDT